MAATARRVAGSAPLTSEQRFVRYTEFAYREIENPSWGDLTSPWVRFYYWINPMHPGPSDVLRWGSDYRGGCGSHTRVVVSMLQASGIQCRPLFLLDESGKSIHTVVQADIDGRWAIADALFGVVFRRDDGTLATAEDLAADSALYHRQVAWGRGYPTDYTYERRSIMNWGKVPVVLPALKGMLEGVFGAHRIDDYARPSIWMWPRGMASLSCAVLAALLFVASAFVSRRRA